MEAGANGRIATLYILKFAERIAVVSCNVTHSCQLLKIRFATIDPRDLTVVIYKSYTNGISLMLIILVGN